jgi:hypothetical protein
MNKKIYNICHDQLILSYEFHLINVSFIIKKIV